jgi:hypothetical protein
MTRFVHPSSLAVAALVPLLGGTAHGQDTGKVGITAQYPTSIGILWQASNRIALRPDVTFSGNSSDSPDGIVNASAWNIGAEFAVPFYLKRYEHVRTYVAPRFDYGYSRSRINTSLASSAMTSTGNSRWGAGVTGLFGAEYSPVTRFTVFAEIGFGYSHSTLPPVTSSSSGSAMSWGTRAAVGAVFYP